MPSQVRGMVKRMSRALQRCTKIVLANVALISELRLLTKKERKEKSNFTKGFKNKKGWWGPCVQITWH